MEHCLSLKSVQTLLYFSKTKVRHFCEYGPLDRDEKNNKTDTFVNIK